MTVSPSHFYPTGALSPNSLNPRKARNFTIKERELSQVSSRLVWRVALATLLILMSSCSSPIRSRSPVRVNIAAAIAATKGSGSSLVGFDFDESVGSALQVVHFTGSYDFASMYGEFTTESPVPVTTTTSSSTTLAEPTGPSTTSTIPPLLTTMVRATSIVSPGNYFVTLPTGISSLVGDKKWGEMPVSSLATFAQQSGLATLQQAMLDPRIWWPILASTSHIQPRGRGILDGNAVHVFDGTANLVTAANTEGPLTPLVDKIVSGMRGGLVPTTIEVDSLGRVRQASVDLNFPNALPSPAPPSGSQLPGSLSNSGTWSQLNFVAVITFVSFGVPTQFSVPAQTDTLPMSEVLSAIPKQPNSTSISPPSSSVSAP